MASTLALLKELIMKSQLTIAVASLLLASAVHAQLQPSQNHVAAAATCVPTGQTSSAQTALNSAGDVGFASGRTGLVTVTCAIPSTLTMANGFSLTYRDTDGSGTSAQITGMLRRKNLTTAAVESLATIDSNRWGAVAGYYTVTGLWNCQSQALDHQKYTYYVQLDLRRTLTTSSVLAATVMVGVRDYVC